MRLRYWVSGECGVTILFSLLWGPFGPGVLILLGVPYRGQIDLFEMIFRMILNNICSEYITSITINLEKWWYLSDFSPSKIWLELILQWTICTNRNLCITVAKMFEPLSIIYFREPEVPSDKINTAKQVLSGRKVSWDQRSTLQMTYPARIPSES